MRSWKLCLNILLLNIVLSSLVCLPASAYANDQISGIWKHTEKPAWLEIIFESGVGAVSIQRHDNNVKAAGLNIIKHLVKDIKPETNQPPQWHGQMYSAAEDGYVSVRLILINSTTITVFESSDVKELNEILRITKVPPTNS
ncbi:hypothetical protein EKO29_07960 [Colwellia sp. Arc7-635]|uniref:hypothetical protein n=1 Tax=Colwellia sp. Arc7-635 TaxID=2497879 RepID=UPI000F851D6C|nr:hypothetical protein [Colwellia sp. Arc7-635]AZQ83954.1 hypothetical protein EKO29_07960 [Colwellia sp. Arc7-635]